eukprot:scaffold78794_cov35-Prasinocladus_malaysianus.AAC.1
MQARTQAIVCRQTSISVAHGATHGKICTAILAHNRSKLPVILKFNKLSSTVCNAMETNLRASVTKAKNCTH